MLFAQHPACETNSRKAAISDSIFAKNRVSVNNERHIFLEIKEKPLICFTDHDK